MSKRKIVIVEDNPADAQILQFAIAQHDPEIQTVVLNDGARAIEYFTNPAHTVPCDLILLDLNLPRVIGFDVLEFLKAESGWRTIPVVVLSSSSRSEDVNRCYSLCANSYICKPTGLDALLAMAQQLINYWFVHVSLAAHVYESRKTRGH